MTFVVIVMVNAFDYVGIKHRKHDVASSGIEPESGASETLILSIVLRGQEGTKLRNEF